MKYEEINLWNTKIFIKVLNNKLDFVFLYFYRFFNITDYFPYPKYLQKGTFVSFYPTDIKCTVWFILEILEAEMKKYGAF